MIPDKYRNKPDLDAWMSPELPLDFLQYPDRAAWLEAISSWVKYLSSSISFREGRALARVYSTLIALDPSDPEQQFGVLKQDWTNLQRVLNDAIREDGEIQPRWEGHVAALNQVSELFCLELKPLALVVACDHALAHVTGRMRARLLAPPLERISVNVSEPNDS